MASSIPATRAKAGIGAMTDERMKDFFDKMVEGRRCSRPDLDYKKAYTLQFVNKGVGLELKKIDLRLLRRSGRPPIAGT